MVFEEIIDPAARLGDPRQQGIPCISYVVPWYFSV